jgi:hypothetical protein
MSNPIMPAPFGGIRDLKYLLLHRGAIRVK